MLTVDSNLCTAKFAVRGLGIYVCALAGLMLVAFTTGIDNVSVSLMCRGSMLVSLSHVLTQLGGNVAAVVIAGCGAIIAAARHRFAWVLGFVLVPFFGGHETRSFSVSRGGRCSRSWSKVRPVMCEANAPKVSSGVSRWMFAMLFLAVFQTCSTGLWSGAYGGR